MKNDIFQKVISFTVIFSLVFSGLVIIAPTVNNIVPVAPETMMVSTGGPLPPGDLPAHQDGVAGDGNDVLVIMTYMHVDANPQHPSYSNRWDPYYTQLGTMVDDLHYLGYTVDTWQMYYYLKGGYYPGQRQQGIYDDMWYHNYWPVDSKGYPDTIESYDDYEMIIVLSTSTVTFGCYNYRGVFESQQPVTCQRAMTGLEDYADNGGSIFWTGYYTGYYLFYYGYYYGNSAVQSNMKQRLGTLFDCTYNRYYPNPGSSGYSFRGYPGTTPTTNENSIGIASRDYNDLWGRPSRTSNQGTYVDIDKGDTIEEIYYLMSPPFPDAYTGYTTYRGYTYSFYHQKPTGNGIQCLEHSYSYGRKDSDWRGAIDGVQSDHDGDFKTVVTFSSPWSGTSYYRHSSGSYRYGLTGYEAARIPLLGSVCDFMIGRTNEPPVADAGEDQSWEQESHAGTEVTLDGSGSYDPDEDPITYAWSWTGGSATGVSPTATYPLGSTTVTLAVSDGELTGIDTVDITIVDTTPPEITYETDQILLWPPNHKYHTVEISDGVTSVTDICDADVDIEDIVITSVSSDEPEDIKGNGDGNTNDDIVIVDSQTVQLRAERQGSGNGRVYTINFKVMDLSENTATGSFTVWVPHDKGKGSTAIDDGASSGYAIYL